MLNSYTMNLSQGISSPIGRTPCLGHEPRALFLFIYNSKGRYCQSPIDQHCISRDHAEWRWKHGQQKISLTVTKLDQKQH